MWMEPWEWTVKSALDWRGHFRTQTFGHNAIPESGQVKARIAPAMPARSTQEKKNIK